MTELLSTPPAVAVNVGEPDVLPAWTPALVDVAITEHERGEFGFSALLADALRRDDRIFTSLDTRILGVLGFPFQLDESDTADTKRLRTSSRTLARRMRGWWYRVLPEAKLADALESSILMGFRVGELSWSRADDGLIYPDLTLHHAQHVRWNPTARRLELLQRNGSPLPITPGDGRWVLFAPAGGARPWLYGSVRTLGIPYLIRQATRRDWADRSEIEGTGIRKAKGPATGAEDKRMTAFVAAIRKLGRKSVLALQEGWDFGIEVTDANAAVLFEKLIAHSETAITLSILGQNLTTQIEGGSHAAATVHAKVLQSRLESDVAMLSVVCRDQILLPWCRYNLPNFDERTLPWPRWDAMPPEDKAKRAQALLAVSQAITGLRAAGVNLTPVLEQFELELEPDADPNDTKVPDATDDADPNADDPRSAAAMRKHRARRRRG